MHSYFAFGYGALSPCLNNCCSAKACNKNRQPKEPANIPLGEYAETGALGFATR